ncbi:MAG: holo-ACP synthase [Candidatus Thorarchaeota archaeon]
MLTDDSELDISIGTDVVEVSRFRTLGYNSPFHDRIFSKKELEYCHGFSDPSSHLAATFAGKEAVFKAANSRYGLSLDNIEILHDDTGAPYVNLHQDCAHDIFVSLSHSSSHAVAVALIVRSRSAQNLNDIQGLLDEAVKHIIHRSEVQ